MNVRKGSERSGRDGGRRNQRSSPTGRRWNRRIHRRLELSRFDSLEEENEDFVAHLTVPSEWRGEVWSGGTMVRTAVTGSSSLAHREK
jgi:hypothetical protein